MRRYFFLMQDERTIPQDEYPVDIQVREPLADGMLAGHQRGFLTPQKEKRTSRESYIIIKPFLTGTPA